MSRNIKTLARLFALTAVFILAPMVARAQEASPTPDPFAGVTIEQLGAGMPGTSPGNALVLLRITMQPGVTIPRHVHPGQVILYVESGEFGTTFGDGDAVITRAATDGGTPTAETPTPNTEVIMNPGDSATYSMVTTHIMHNPGNEPLVLLVSALLSADQPGFLFQN